MSKLREIKSESDALQGALEALRRNVGVVAESLRIITEALEGEGFSRAEAIQMALEILKRTD